MAPTHYDSLELDAGASDDAIRCAYLKKAKKYHPDKNDKPEANTIFQHINEAYRVGSRTTLRREYDHVIGVCGDTTYDESTCEFELLQNSNSLTLNIAPKLLLVWMEICTAFYSTKPTNKGVNARQNKSVYENDDGSFGTISLTFYPTTSRVLVQGRAGPLG